MQSNPCLEITAGAVALFQVFGLGYSFVLSPPYLSLAVSPPIHLVRQAFPHIF